MPAAAIPLVAAGIGTAGSLGAAAMARRGAQGASRPGAQEREATRGQMGAAGDLRQQGSYFSGYGKAALQQPTSYFSSLAGGDRAKMTQTLAPDIENVNQLYGGTSRNLRRFLRGPDRDFQLGELERERTGQVASLFRNGRNQANATLAGLAQNALDLGGRSTAQAGSLFGQAAGQGAGSRLAGADIERQAGADAGGLIFELLRSYAGSGQGRARNTGILPSRQTTPGYTGYMPGR